MKSHDRSATVGVQTNKHTTYSTVLTTRGAGEPAIEDRTGSESTAARVCAVNCVREGAA